MSATIRDGHRYRIIDGGNPGWHVVRRYNLHGVRMVELHNPDLDQHAANGRATINCPESHLILADARTAVASAPGVTAAANPITPRPAPGAESPVNAGGFPSLAVAATTGPAAGSALLADPAAPIDEPRARTTDPQPAHDAAKTAKALAGERRIICLLAHERAGDEGLTGDELEIATGIEYDVIGPRRPWLETNGFVAPNGQRRTNRKGNTEGVYVITETGRDMCRRLRLEGKVAA